MHYAPSRGMAKTSFASVLTVVGWCAIACGSPSSENASSSPSDEGDVGTQPPANAPPENPIGGPGTPGPGAPGADPGGPSGPPQMLFIGRFDTTDPIGPKASWP